MVLNSISWDNNPDRHEVLDSNEQALKLTRCDDQVLNELCDWITANCLEPITWEMLTLRSGLSQRELLTKFAIHLKTTPMTYIRQCKESRTAQTETTSLPTSLKRVKKISTD